MKKEEKEVKKIGKKTEEKPNGGFSEKKNNEPAPRIVRESELPAQTSMVQVTEFARPIVSVKEAQEAFAQYQDLINALITQKDVQPIKNKKTGEVKLTGKKTAFNKLARFFGISVEIIKEKQEIYTGPRGGTILIAKVWAKATAPNGQFRVAGAACSSSERMFAHLYHDVFATAETRATKRAIEGLIGMGELELAETNGETNQSPKSDPDQEHLKQNKRFSTIEEAAQKIVREEDKETYENLNEEI